MTSSDTTEYTVRIDDGSTFGPASVDQLRTWAQEGRLDESTTLQPDDGGPPLNAGDLQPLQGHFTSGNEAMSAIIPWRNKCALVGYYIGIFGLIPLLGVPLALAGIVLGILGIGHWKKNHRAHGLAHSIIAIICGLLGLLITLGLILVPLLYRSSTT